MRADKARDLTLKAIRLEEQGRIEAAADVFRKLIAGEPASATHRMNLGTLYLNHGRIEAAIQELSRACALDRTAALAFFNLGLAYYRIDALSQAARNFSQALRADPAMHAAAILASLSLSRMGRVDAARQLHLSPEMARDLDAETRNQLALALSGVDRFEEAEAVLRELLSEYPGHAAAAINLAGILERANRLEEASRVLEPVAGERLDAVGRLLAAKLQRRTGNAAAAAARLREIRPLVSGASNQLLSDLEFELGRCMDLLGDYGAAVEAFTQGKRLIREFVARQYPPAREAEEPAWLQDDPELDAHAERLAGAAGADVENPIFVVGFPRSGTTLIDQVLDAHPDLQVLEEKPALESVVDALDRTPPGYPQVLRQLQPGELDKLRRVYWDTASRFLQRRPNTRLVDKQPFNFSRLHLIKALFPRAKMIFVLRHPCDVVLSCFMQSFRFISPDRGFWTIEDSAALYVQSLDLWLRQSARLQPDCLALRYEDVVDDLPAQVQRIAAFLGIAARDEMIRFHQHARTRRINTPSYSQVVQPIYRSSMGKWRHYRPWFSAVEERLLTVADRLGYPRPEEAAEAAAAVVR